MEFVTLSVSEMWVCYGKSCGSAECEPWGGEWLNSTAVLVHSATASGLRKWCG